MLSAKELAIFAVALNKTKKTVKRFNRDLLQPHKQLIELLTNAINGNIKDKSMKPEQVYIELVIDPEIRQYAIDFLGSYLENQKDLQKAKRDPVYRDLQSVYEKLRGVIGGVIV
jgi:hypothetical protein